MDALGNGTWHIAHSIQETTLAQVEGGPQVPQPLCRVTMLPGQQEVQESRKIQTAAVAAAAAVELQITR